MLFEKQHKNWLKLPIFWRFRRSRISKDFANNETCENVNETFSIVRQILPQQHTVVHFITILFFLLSHSLPITDWIGKHKNMTFAKTNNE